MSENTTFPEFALCEICHGQEGILREDPYLQEKYEEIVFKYICSDCYKELCDAI